MEGEYKPKGGWFIAFCLGLIAGVAVFSLHEHTTTQGDIDFYIGKKISFYGTVVSEPKPKGNNQELDIAASELDDKTKLKGKIRVTSNLFPQFEYGDYVKVSCLLQKPENKTFNYQRYLARYHIYATCFRARLEKIGDNHGNVFIKILLGIKQKSQETIERYVGEPESSLIGPVLFGGGDDIGDDLLMTFRRTGLTHIMAVSGFNVGILAAGIAYLLFLLGLRRILVFIITSLVTISYVIMVGAPASAVRAGIMSILLLFALAIGRLSRLHSIVIITAAGSLIFNPLLLAADIGWQLSFAAILGLLYLYPVIKKVLDKIFSKRLGTFVDVLAATVAAQLSTTPISLYHFGQVSIISPLANLLVVWSIPLLTAASAIALPLSLLIPSIGTIVFLPSFIIARYIFFITSFLSRFDWAMFIIS